MSERTIQQARQLYNIAHWGEGYFDIGSNGHLMVYPDAEGSTAGIDLFSVAEEVHRAGLSLPVLLRFPAILQSRVGSLCEAFTQAMQRDDYSGRHIPVYPIKVNQQRRVVEEILANQKGRVGLEAGSKPELMVALARCQPGEDVIVCNGYKDREYVRLALIGKRLGHRIYIVVEKSSELALVIEESRRLGVDPLLGLRVRLASIGKGMWQNTGGEKSKFGLSAAEVLRTVDELRGHDMLHALDMLHVHIGSQVSNIRDIQRALRECARYFAELHRLGAKIGCVDIGGGLGVDYEGTRSRSFCSMNYGIQEYANNAVRNLKEVCDERGLPQPHIITESGRAMTAHHAVLLVNVIEVERIPDAAGVARPGPDEPTILHDLWSGFENLGKRSLIETYHEAVHWMGEAQVMYTHGLLSLQERAHAEEIYFATCWKLRDLLNGRSRAQREVLDELNDKLADKYFCNFSVFKSLPDVWALEQIFPIVPLHRLEEQAVRRGVLHDITCDSDGRIDHYVDAEGVETSLPLHPLEEGEPYLLGMFMVGAYQEILGDIHNLFGSTDSVNVLVDDQGGFRLDDPVRGDTVDAVLQYVRFQPEELLAAYRERTEEADLRPGERALYLQELEVGLAGYTYLEDTCDR